MKRILSAGFLPRLETVLVLVCGLLAHKAGAGLAYWDNNGSSPATSGTWDTTTPQWSTSTSLTATPTVWNTTNAAVFCAGTASTGIVAIRLDVPMDCPGLFNGSLVPPGCQLTISGAGSINLPAALAGFSVGVSGSTTLAVPITGPGTVVAEAGGPLYLDATNTHTGGTFLGYHGTSFTGTLHFNNAKAFGPGGIYFSNCPNCTVAVEGSSAMTVTNSIATTNISVNLVGNLAGLTFSGPLTLTTHRLSLGVDGADNLVILSGVISGPSGSLGKYGSSVLEVTGNNTYAGGTTVSNGIFLAANTAGSATGTGAVNVTNFSGNAGTLTGSGAVSGAVSVSGNISATNATGGTATLTTGPLTMFGGAHYPWGVNNVTGTEGDTAGWDLITVDGSLTNLATAGSPWNIDVVSLAPVGTQGQLNDFDNRPDFSWRIIHTTGAIKNFSTNTIKVTTTSFAPDPGIGHFYLSTNGTPNDIYLNFLHVPVIGSVSGDQAVAATGTATISVSTPSTVLTSLVAYQWQHNGTNLADGGRISGSSTATLTIGGAVDSDAGSYTVSLANTAGTATSGVSVLTVVEPPVISSVTATVSSVTNVVFNAVVGPATATFGATYQWSVGGTVLSDNGHIAGSGTASLTVINASAADLGVYTLVMGNIANRATNSAIFTAPRIASATGSQTVTATTTVYFSVALNQGTGPVSYQWRLGGVNLSDGSGITGSATTSLTVTAADATAGSYDVVASNPGGQATSSPATLTVVDPPVISSITPSVASGSNIVFTAAVNPAKANIGAIYQWSTGGINLSDGAHFAGSTSTNLTIIHASAADLGAYTLVVTNIAGNAINSAIFSAPVIAFSSGNQSAMATSNVFFTVSLSQGTTPVTYQWRAGEVNLTDSASIVGSSSAALTVTASDATAGTYDVVVSNPGGQDVSFPAVLTVHDPALITVQPTNQSLECGGTAVLTASVSGNSPLSFQWYAGNSMVAGATNSSLTLAPASVEESGSYTLVVTNVYGSATSQVAVLSVADTTAPVMTVNGPTVTNVIFQAAFSDPGATATDVCAGSLPVTTSGAVNVEALGGYTLTYTASDPSGNAVTNTRLVNVVQVPTIIAEPVSRTNNTGTTASFSVAAVGSPTLTYHWFSLKGTNSTALAGKTNAALSFAVSSTNQSLGYYVVITNAFGKATSDVVQLTVYQTPSITAQPALLQKPVAGNNASFSVKAAGTEPLSYQWNFDGTPIADATATNYVLTNVQAGDSGTYTCTVSNISGVTVTTTNTHGVLNVQADMIKPTVAIGTPKAGALFTNGVAYGGVVAPEFALAGSVADNGLITNITVQRVGPVLDEPVAVALFGSEPGMKTFTNHFTLAAGTNTYQVWATDSAGNVSAKATRSVVFVVKSLFTLLTNGTGKVTSTTGATNHALLQVGRNYTISASEATGVNWLFSYWSSGSDAGSLTPLSTAANLTFMMESNLVLQANFVTNLFTAAAGAYNGLFYPTNGVTEQSSGLFTVTIANSSKGGYSGKLYLGGANYPLSGNFNLAGDAVETVKRTGKTAVTVALHLNLNPFDNLISGSVSNAGWFSPLSGEVSTFNGTTVKATNFAGRYTMVMAGSNSYGAATITNSVAGNSLLSGNMADGAAFNQSVQISEFGDVPFYASLYGGKGLALGWLTFSNGVGGTLSWIKPAGFTNMIVVTGSKYTPGGRILNLTNGTLTLSGGNLSAPLVYTVGLSSANVLSNAAGVPTNKLSVAFTPATGAMKVTFQPTGAKTQTVGQGVVLQGVTNAAGWFPGTNQSGSFFLQ